MMRKSWKGVVVAVVAATLVVSGSAKAQWTVLPGGGVGYAFDYVTGGTFSCLDRAYLSGLCVANGNSLTINDGEGGSASWTFTGATSSLLARNMGQDLVLGTFTSTASPGFSLPGSTRRPNRYFRFTGGIQTNPSLQPVSPTWGALYYGGGTALSPSVSTHGFTRNLTFQLPPAPTHADYPYLVIHKIGMPKLAAGGDPSTVMARYSLIPEPGTWALMGTGLLGLAGIGVVRGRRES